MASPRSTASRKRCSHRGKLRKKMTFAGYGSHCQLVDLFAFSEYTSDSIATASKSKAVGRIEMEAYRVGDHMSAVDAFGLSEREKV
jgi:hypothetical protein